MVENLSGKRFGKLRVTDIYERRGYYTYWLCKCDCGNEKYVCSSNLKNGSTQSCGCSRFRKKHGESTLDKRTRLYNIWGNMIARCYAQNASGFERYGGVGITVCDEWRNSYEAFATWAREHGYSEDLTLDRINGKGNYEPSNCRWVTRVEQQNNRKNNHVVIYQGKEYTVAQLARHLNINYSTLNVRLHRGWSVERATAM